MSLRREDKSKYDRPFEEYKHKYYKDLRDGLFKVKFSEKILKCPFCPESKDYTNKDLLRHASRISHESKSAVYKDKARHMALEKYLERDFCAKLKSPKSANQNRESISAKFKDKTEHMPLDEPLKRDISDTIKCPNSANQSVVPSPKSNEELIVWPWMILVANIPLVKRNDRYVGENDKKLKDEWIKKGYNPVKVHPLWNYLGHSGIIVVEFGKDFNGFNRAMMFVKDYEVNKHGRKDFYDRKKCKDDKLYAWVARDEDYHSHGLVGDYIRKNGDLKTVSAIVKEDEEKNAKLVFALKTLIDEKNIKTEEIKSEISKTDSQLKKVMKQKEAMTDKYNREMEMMYEKANYQLERIAFDHEERKRQLVDREKELRAREAKNETEKKELDNEKKKNESAIVEQKKADERMLKLAEDQKREKEKLHKIIIELQQKLDDKQRLELEIEQMKGALEVRKHLNDEDIEAKKKKDFIQDQLKEKEEELELLEDLSNTLIIKERKSNEELVEARKELISGLSENTARSQIFVKIMGELDEKPFIAAAKKRGSGKKVVENAIKLSSFWEEHLGDPSWHPFKVVTVGDKCEEILDEEDGKIASLKDECDKEVYNAVVTAIKELNEYNPSGRYPVQELWNKKAKRKATLKEGIEYIINQWKPLKKRK